MHVCSMSKMIKLPIILPQRGRSLSKCWDRPVRIKGGTHSKTSKEGQVLPRAAMGSATPVASFACCCSIKRRSRELVEIIPHAGRFFLGSLRLPRHQPASIAKVHCVESATLTGQVSIWHLQPKARSYLISMLVLFTAFSRASENSDTTDDVQAAHVGKDLKKRWNRDESSVHV